MISKISATQMSCTDDYENNILKAIQLIKKAKEDDSNVVLLQELFERKYFCQVEDYDRFREEGGNIDDMMDGLGF